MNAIKQEHLLEHLLSGAIAGAVSRTCTAPLDRLKVFLQVRGAEYGGIRACWRQLIKDGGYSSLWRGNYINVLKIAPETALKFTFYEHAKRVLRGDSSSELNAKQRFLAGAIAGALSQTVIYPMEVLKTRLVLGQTGDHRGICHCLMKLLRTEGFRALYRGYIPNMLGIIPYAGIDLTVYETLKRRYLKTHADDKSRGLPKNEVQWYVPLCCGAVSSSCAQLVSYPLALVRTKLQATPIRSDSSHVTMIILFKQIYRREGLRGFYRGIAPNFMKVVPAVSVTYVCYEQARRLLGAEMCQ